MRSEKDKVCRKEGQDMADSGYFAKTIIGQILLIVCCIFYLIWWSISYRPDVEVNRAGGLNGILLLITAACGLLGTAFSLLGANGFPKNGHLKLSGFQIIIGGIIAYVLLLLITVYIFHRQVTTELLLITGWAMMELMVISSLNGAGRLSDPRFWILFAVIAVAFVISMVLYVLYYRMEAMKAFYAAMIPLITEAVSMGVGLLVILV